MAAAAYSTAYADKPIDVAGSIAAGADKNVDFAIKQEEKKETERKQRKDKNEKLYGNAVANIIDTTDGPPDSQQISAQVGDRIAYLVQESGLEGIELQNAINSATKYGNSAINDVNTRFAEFETTKNKKPNRYLNLNGEQEEINAFNNGNRALQWDMETGRPYWVGDGVRTEIGTPTKDAEKTPDYSLKLEPVVKKITSNYGANPTTTRFTENIPQIENDLTTYVTQSMDTFNKIGNVAATIKGEDGESDLYSNEQLQQFNDIGARLAEDATTVSAEDKKIYEDIKKKTIDFKSEQVGVSMYGGAWQNRAATTASINAKNTPKVKTPKTPKTPIETKEYIKDVTKILDASSSVADVEELVNSVKENDASGAIEALKANDVNLEVKYDDADGLFTGDKKSGSFTVDGGETLTFTDAADLKSQLSQLVLGENSELIQKFSNIENVVQGANYGQISTDLGISFRGQNIGFQPSDNGVTVSKGSKSFPIPLEGLTPARRKQRIQTIIDNL